MSGASRIRVENMARAVEASDLAVRFKRCILALAVPGLATALAFSGTVDAQTGESAPDARPNILLIVADDLGYTDIGAFGSEIPTPNLDELAMNGVRFTNFHTDRGCAQSRVMLMAGAGTSAALETQARLDIGLRSMRLGLGWASLPELLQDAGYATYMSGKWDLGFEPTHTPAARGFDRSFALLAAVASHFAEPLFGDSSLYELDGARVPFDDLPVDFYSTDYYTDTMIEFLNDHAGPAPWFAYVPYTTPHLPLQVPAEWLDRHTGGYDAGYDELRESRVASASEIGVIPPGAVLDGFEPVAPPWSELTEEERRRYARAQELYAAMVENMDLHVGRLVDYLEESGQLDDTVIVFMSDHGASPGEYGHRDPILGEGGPRFVPEIVDNRFENWGRPNSMADRGRGFAEAATAPLIGYKSSYNEGGLRAVAFVYYPQAVPQGEIDGEFITVMDVLPTFLEIAGTAHPGAGEYRGRQISGGIRGRSFWPYLTGRADAVHGRSDSAGWTGANAGGGALIRGGFKVINIAPPGETGLTPWRLYDLDADPGERRNLAAQLPDLTAELVAEWESDWR